MIKYTKIRVMDTGTIIVARIVIRKLERYIREKLFNFMLWRTVQKLHISCILWDLRGLERCKVHGFHAQSWINGECKKCKQENLK